MRIMYMKKKKLWFMIIIGIIILFGVLIINFWPNHWLSVVSSQTRLVPIYEVDTKEQAVAISFDASWGAEHTPAILDTLDSFEVKATFFLVNIWLDDYPAMAEMIVERGHEVGLHSASHPHCTELSDNELIAELKDNHDMIIDITGYTPSLFRPPFGDYDNRVVELTNACGYDCIQWSVDSWDWMDLSADEIVAKVMKEIHTGDIVLFHNNGLHTAEALPIILAQLKAREINAVSISELLITEDSYIDYNGIQRQK